MSEPNFIKLNEPLNPDKIAFSVGPEEAINSFVRLISRNRLNSTQMLDFARMGRIRAEYMPVCLMGCKAITRAEATCTGENQEQFSAQRVFGTEFSQIIVSAGKIADDVLLRLLEPYVLNAVGESGAELEEVRILEVDLTEQELFEKVRPDLDKRISEQINVSFNDYKDHSLTASQTEFGEISLRYLHLPVWVLESEENGQIHRLFINGQTGKVAGVVPKSRRKFTALLVAAAVAGAVLGQLIWTAVSALI